MSASLLHVGAMVQCLHGFPVLITPGSPRVLLSGMPAATVADAWLPACTNPPSSGNKCTAVQWLAPALRVRIGQQPAVLQASSGLCLGTAPPGPPVVISAQPRVLGT